jgi:hypothetical protein
MHCSRSIFHALLSTILICGVVWLVSSLGIRAMPPEGEKGEIA